MKIAVYGASGYVGHLVARELVRRGVDMVLIGRNLERLRETAAAIAPKSVELTVAALDDPRALTKALHGCDSVISCVAPFVFWGEPVIRAAIDAGCHYVDTSGEPVFIKKVFDDFSSVAEQAGVAIVQAATDDCLPSNLLAQLIAKRAGPLERLTVVHGLFDTEITRGTLRSFIEISKGTPYVFKDGEWLASTSEALGAIDLPGEDVPTAVWRSAGPPVITIPRHVETRYLELATNFAPQDNPTALTPEMVEAAPVGPSEEVRLKSRLSVVAIGLAEDGSEVRAHLTASDLYNLTAVVAGEAAVRLARGDRPSGVLAPAQAFDAAEFLDALAPWGVKWAVQ